MAESVPRTLEQVAAIGYQEVEFAGYFDTPPAQLRSLLDATGLTAPSAHVSFESLGGDDWQRVLDDANTVGHRYVVIAWVPEEARRTLDDYRRLADRLEQAAARAVQSGLSFAYHNHEFEFEPIDGTIPYDILASADPELVQLQLDLYWIRDAGHEARAYFAQYPGRFPSVHVKDMAADGQMVDVGAGVIDWPELLEQAAQAGTRHFFVEHDNPPDPMHSIRESFAYLQRLEA